MRTTRPADFFREWYLKGAASWGVCKMHPKEPVAHVSIHADFTRKQALAMRQFAKWLERAARNLEASDE